MLKVLHLFESYLPQTENWAYNLIRHLPDVAIHIGANHYLKNNFYHPDFHYVDNYFDGLKKQNGVLKKNSLLGIFKKVWIKASAKILGDPIQVFEQYIKDHQIEILHAHFGKVAWHFRQLAQRTKLPLVISFYGWDYEMLPFLQPRYKKYYQQLFELAACFICEGKHGASILEKMGCPREKIKVIHLGVALDRIPFYERDKKPKQLRLLQLASFTEKKGHWYTVQAFQKALVDCPNLHLTLVGNERSAGLRQKIIDWIDRQKLNDKITLLERIDYQVLYPFFKNYEVFIHPSCYTEQRDCEGGAPIVLLDAQATGMPIISTRHCDIPGEVIHGKTGWLAEEKEVETLAEYIRQAYHLDQAAYLEMSRAARTHVAEHFDVGQSAQQLSATYTALLKSVKQK